MSDVARNGRIVIRDYAGRIGTELLLWTDIGKARSGAGGALAGSAGQIVGKLNRYIDMGIRAFIFQDTRLQKKPISLPDCFYLVYQPDSYPVADPHVRLNGEETTVSQASQLQALLHAKVVILPVQ